MTILCKLCSGPTILGFTEVYCKNDCNNFAKNSTKNYNLSSYLPEDVRPISNSCAHFTANGHDWKFPHLDGLIFSSTKDLDLNGYFPTGNILFRGIPSIPPKNWKMAILVGTKPNKKFPGLSLTPLGFWEPPYAICLPIGPKTCLKCSGGLYNYNHVFRWDTIVGIYYEL